MKHISMDWHFELADMTRKDEKGLLKSENQSFLPL